MTHAVKEGASQPTDLSGFEQLAIGDPVRCRRETAQAAYTGPGQVRTCLSHTDATDIVHTECAP
jgi:hypothetical protein